MQPPNGNRSRGPNVLQITADDMNHDSVGCYGCRVPEVTPHVDRLAAEGLRFERGHVTIAVCQPSRQVWMTGRYPHRNGALGFGPIDDDVPTLQESLRAAGYLNGIIGKPKHLQPAPKYCWDLVVGPDDIADGRDPDRYHRAARGFLDRARSEGRPFFLMVNSHDPHRPFAGSWREKRHMLLSRRRYPPAPRTYRPEQVDVPGFLPDLPAVRRELACYYASVARCDQTAGAVLQALDETGLRDDTLVLFMSDHGMAFPFAKTNCYLSSTKIPWVVRWPGRIREGSVERDHFVSGIDFMPTILEVCGAGPVEGMDGRSFVPLLEGRPQEGRSEILTVLNETSAGRRYPIRCLQNLRFGYICNAWADGKTVFLNESQRGRTYRAMLAEARSDANLAARIELFRHRVPEELYDLERDPHALRNLAGDPALADVLADLRRRLLERLEATGDPWIDEFRRVAGAG